MGNEEMLILKEAERITDYIIQKKRHKLDSVKVIDECIDEKYRKYRIEIHAYIPLLLTKKKYDIISTDPLIVRKF